MNDPYNPENINFTDNVPVLPGAYWWRPAPNERHWLVEIWISGTNRDGTNKLVALKSATLLAEDPVKFGGQWSNRLQ